MTTLENESEKKRNNHLYNVLGKEVDDEESIVEVVNYEPVELATVITRIDITKIRGVGPSVAEKLRGGGFRTVEQIANTTVGQLMDIRSIGQATAQKILEGAKALLPSKNLVNFPQASQVTTPSPHIVQELSVDIIELEPVLEDESEEIFEPEVEERDLETKVEMKRLLQKAITSPELVQRPVPISPNHKIEKASQRTSSEKINREDKIKIIQRIVSEARELGYENLKVVPSLRKIYSLVDLVMFKVIPFNEILDLIVIVPIKVSNLKGNLQISNETIRYIPYDQGINEGSVYKSLLDSCFNQLDECQGLIYQDLREEGHFIDYLRRFHNVDISLKKTILKRNLSFNSGNQQIKILVEPILLCENEIGFLEKIIPFAYLKDVNLHIIQTSNLTRLLGFLEQKYRQIESHNSQDTSLLSYESAQTQLFRRIEFASVPFLGLAAVFLLLGVFESFEILSSLLNFGYAFFGIYIIVLFYFNMKFYKYKTDLQLEFSTPYHKRVLTFDETSLVLINEEFTPEMMTQFVFECLGKNNNSKFITQIEEHQISESVSEKQFSSKVKNEVFFEEEEKSKEPENEFVVKYSSFLED